MTNELLEPLKCYFGCLVYWYNWSFYLSLHVLPNGAEGASVGQATWHLQLGKGSLRPMGIISLPKLPIYYSEIPLASAILPPGVSIGTGCSLAWLGRRPCSLATYCQWVS